MLHNVLYKIIAIKEKNVFLVQLVNKFSVFNLTITEILQPDYLCHFAVEQAYSLGVYCAHYLPNINIGAILQSDKYKPQQTCLLVATIYQREVILFNLQPCELETMKLSFIAKHMNTLGKFTAVQAFFIGIQSGYLHNKSINDIFATDH